MNMEAAKRASVVETTMSTSKTEVYDYIYVSRTQTNVLCQYELLLTVNFNRSRISLYGWHPLVKL